MVLRRWREAERCKYVHKSALVTSKGERKSHFVRYIQGSKAPIGSYMHFGRKTYFLTTEFTDSLYSDSTLASHELSRTNSLRSCKMVVSTRNNLSAIAAVSL
jgi:hypothetical protein